MINGAVLKRLQTLDETLGAAGLDTNKVDVKNEEKVMEIVDVMKPAALSELCPHVVKTVRKVREASYSLFSFHNVDFGEIVNEHRLIHRDFCRTHLIWCLATCHIMFEAVMTTPIFRVMS